MKKKKTKINQKKRREKRNRYKQELQDKIKKYNNILACPPTGLEKMDSNSHSWFTIKKSTFQNHSIKINIKNDFPDYTIKCQKVVIKFNDQQRKIIFGWMRASEIMFNDTIRYFKTQRFNGEKAIISFRKLRNDIFRKRINELSNKYNMPTHILVCAINRACSCLKSCLSNLKNGHIKHFRIRYIKEKHATKILDIESLYFSSNKNTFCKRFLGNYIDSNGYDLTEVDSDSKLHFNKKENRFTLLVPLKSQLEKNKNQHTITLDPGLREFLTGVSDNHFVEIGSNVSQTIKSNLARLDKINGNDELPKKIKKRYEKVINKKIHNLVTDMQWKCINFLTGHYKNIFIGKWSTKNISSNGTSVLRKMQKRIAGRIRFYEFLQKLKYKCDSKGVNLIVTHEGYTSRLCSKCGWDNKKLGGSHVFDCKKCGLSIGRDINGARNIFIKSLD